MGSASQATLGSALTHLVDCTVLLDTDGRIIAIDDTVTAVFGHAPDDMVGAMIWDYVHPDDLPEAAEIFERELTNPGFREANPTLRCAHCDGRWRYCEVLCGLFTVNDDGSVLIGVRWIGQDEHDGALTRGLRALSGPSGFESRYDCLVVLDRSGIVVAVDDRIESLLGDTAGAFVGVALWDRVHPDDLEIARAAFERELASPESRGATPIVRLHHRDGTWRRCEAVSKNKLGDPVVKGIVQGYRYIGANVTQSGARVAMPLWKSLTPAEQDLVTAVSCGLSNKQIAARYDKSVRTVETQLSAIYRKLGLRSRSQLAIEAHAR